VFTYFQDAHMNGWTHRGTAQKHNTSSNVLTVADASDSNTFENYEHTVSLNALDIEPVKKPFQQPHAAQTHITYTHHRHSWRIVTRHQC